MVSEAAPVSLPKGVRAVAWDPRCPATLQIPSTTTTTTTATATSDGNNDQDDGRQQQQQQQQQRLDVFISHDGIGCNTHEMSAVMELLDARDAYLASSSSSSSSHMGGHNQSHHPSTAIRAVSKAYRKALAGCAQGWQEEETTMGETDDETGDEDENLDLLKIAYAVTQLSETFLLTPSHNDSSMMMMMEDYYESTSSLPGAVTADTVRYLRLHHMADPTVLVDDRLMEDLETSLQPEHVDGGEVYWELMESFLKRGCVQDAWALLSRHSLRRRAMESLTMESGVILDDYQVASLEEDRQGFRAMEALLLSAPLPGGRTDSWDADFDSPPGEDEEDQEELLEGIPPSAYRLWESNDTNRGSGDYPVHFQANIALQTFHSWQKAVKSLPEVQRLTRRIPQLHRLLAVLAGDFTGVKFGSWAEAFCAELLYKVPNLRLVDMHVRASHTMKKYGKAEGGGLEEVILSVMKGNAGRVVEVLHELGGGSGAALPAVMTSLLCNLLDDAQVMPTPSTEYNLRTELLLSASFAIRSSMAIEGHDDIGTRLAVRCLLPHIQLESDLRITATLVNTLEHHSPQTDSEAKGLLDLCRTLVERKNIRVLDGCVSICLARYRYFLSDHRPGGAVHWLLTGMELECLVLCGGPAKRTAAWQRALSTGVCYRLLVTYCMETSEGLLKGILGEGEGVSLLYARGKEMSSALEQSELAGFMSAVKVLEYVVIMAEAIAERKDDSLVAASIITCLEDRANDEDDGVVSSLARSSMYWNLIRLAKVILDRNSEREGVEELHLYMASFDVRGMQVLLEKFTILLATLKMESQSDHDHHKVASPYDEESQAIRLALAEGLMRAFVAENATKKLANYRTKRMSLAGINAAQLGQVSREQQELVVQNMLDF